MAHLHELAAKGFSTIRLLIGEKDYECAYKLAEALHNFPDNEDQAKLALTIRKIHEFIKEYPDHSRFLDFFLSEQETCYWHQTLTSVVEEMKEPKALEKWLVNNTDKPKREIEALVRTYSEKQKLLSRHENILSQFDTLDKVKNYPEEYFSFKL